jgi:hypothetical protein
MCNNSRSGDLAPIDVVEGRQRNPLHLGAFVEYSQDMALLTPEEIGRLSRPERIALNARLWDSLNDDQLRLTTDQEFGVGAPP